MQIKQTYIRAISVGSEIVIFELPEWKLHHWFELPKAAIPYKHRHIIEDGGACWVDINFDASSVDQLMIQNWKPISLYSSTDRTGPS